MVWAKHRCRCHQVSGAVETYLGLLISCVGRSYTRFLRLDLEYLSHLMALSISLTSLRFRGLHSARLRDKIGPGVIGPY